MSPSRNRAYREKRNIRIAMGPQEQVYFDQLPRLADYVPLNRGIWAGSVKINKANLEMLREVPRDESWTARIYLANADLVDLTELRRAWLKSNDESVNMAIARLGPRADLVKYVVKVTYHDCMAGLRVWRFPPNQSARALIEGWIEECAKQREEERQAFLATHRERLQQEVDAARKEVAAALADS